MKTCISSSGQLRYLVHPLLFAEGKTRCRSRLEHITRWVSVGHSRAFTGPLAALGVLNPSVMSTNMVGTKQSLQHGQLQTTNEQPPARINEGPARVNRDAKTCSGVADSETDQAVAVLQNFGNSSDPFEASVSDPTLSTPLSETRERFSEGHRRQSSACLCLFVQGHSHFLQS